MINWYVINDIDINWIKISSKKSRKESKSSFSDTSLTKYSHVSNYWLVYNFNSVADMCEWMNQTYWNALTEHNLNDAPQISVVEYESPLKNWWIIQNRRFDRYVFKLKVTVYADSIEDLEKEIQMMKVYFNWEWKLRKKYNWMMCEIWVELTDFKLGEMQISGTECEIEFLSLDPFWVDQKTKHQAFENMTEFIDWTLVISDSDFEPILTTIIQMWEVTWTIDNLKLEYNWYEIEVADVNIPSWAVIVFDGKKWTVTVNWVEKFYLWEFFEFPLKKPAHMSFSFGSWTVDKYSMYILYDKIVL